MTRKHSKRQPKPVRLPPGLRPGLSREKLRALALIHVSMVDALVGGTADLRILWEWMAAVLTWSRVASESGVGEEQIDGLTEVVHRVVARFEATGSVRLEADEIEIARDGAVIMDMLAETVDLDVARRAGDWAREQILQLQSGHPAEP